MAICNNKKCSLGECDQPETCAAYVPVITNADRIRSMTDEELEEGIRSLSLGYEPWCDHHCKMQGEDNCNICLKNWLKQPAKNPKEV